MPPTLTAALVAGPCRRRAERVIAALGRQTMADDLEIVVVDLADPSVPPLAAPPGVPFVYARRPGLVDWGRAKAEAVRAASAPFIAFTEDHCYPERGWAQAILAAHAGPWAAVGYAFTNANPRTAASRAGLVARYGLFLSPTTSGVARYLPGNNVSYRCDSLLAFGDRLDTLLDIDFNLQEALRAAGHELFVEATARSAHENYTTLAGECRAGRPYCRLLAAHRATIGRWSAARRILYGLLSPVSAPFLRLFRLTRHLARQPAHWGPFAAGLPWILAMYVSDGWGESAGYLWGSGDAARGVLRYELETERDV